MLFVVDNSRSRPLSQMQLAAAADAFVATLEDPAFAVDYRIGITTTDNGGPCSGTTPEGGAFVLQSCRERLDDFVAEDIDVTDAGCRWVCDLDRLETLPTALLGHDGLQSRPWIERVDGHTNLAPGIDPAAAVACALPQGTRGCGYEMPLEAMRKALRRSVVPEEASYGFLVGSDAQLIVFVTDEIDCSMRFEHNDLFYGGDAPSGPSWDSDEPPPTCWDYAARCEGGPGVYDQCWPADIGRDRTPSDPDDAVLVPMSVYHEALATPWSTWPHVYVAGIVGVPRGEAPIVYADPDDPSNELGIGWGCEGEHGNALAPLRLAELAEAFAGDGAPMLESICEPDLEPALGRIATRVAEALEPPCMRWPLADASPDVPGLQPDCLFVEAIETLDQTTFTQLPVCLGDGSMPARADACVHLRDEPRCGAQGYGQAATLRRTPGPAPTAAERTIYFDCVFED